MQGSRSHLFAGPCGFLSARSFRRFAVLTACVVAISCWAGVGPGDDFNANTERAASALQGWYNGSGLWDTTGWWNAANCLEAIENVIVENNGQSYLSVLNNTFTLNSGGNFLNYYYDHEGWWANAWIRAFDLTGDTRYLNMAKTIFTDLTGGWDSTCGGGVLLEPCEPFTCGFDGPQFKGIFIRYLAYLYDVDRKPAYFNFLFRNAHSIWFNDRDGSDHLGLRWSGPFDSADASRQSSAMMPVSALAEPTTSYLSFAKGSADPTAFNQALLRLLNWVFPGT
jgi:predicted alpha-1,6-mannanase (GH76 family)